MQSRVFDGLSYCKPEFISSLSVGSYLTADTDVDVLVTLCKQGLLPETDRLNVVKAISDLAVQTPDAGFLDAGVRTLCTPIELAEILSRVREEVLPHLHDVVYDWRSNYSLNNSQEPGDYFAELATAFEEYKQAFKGDEEALGMLSKGLKQITEAVDELNAEKPGAIFRADSYSPVAASLSDPPARSVFDDVDVE